MTSEQEVLAEIARVIMEALSGDSDIREVFTFGGGSHGLPGLRVNRTNGQSCFLVATVGDSFGTTSEPPSTYTKEGEFCALVREAIREKQPEIIARTDTVLEQMMPVGLAFTDSTGYIFKTRAFCTAVTPFRPIVDSWGENG